MGDSIPINPSYLMTNELMFYAGGTSALFFMVLTLFLTFVFRIPKKISYMLKLKGYMRFERISKRFEELSLKYENEENTSRLMRFLFIKFAKKKNNHVYERRNTSKLVYEDEEEMWSLE